MRLRRGLAPLHAAANAVPTDAERRHWLRRALAVAGGGAMAAGTPAAAAAASARPAWTAELPALSKGLNLTHWFEYERGQAVSVAELRMLAGLGLDHVRIPLDPLVCGWQLHAGAPMPFMPALREALTQAIDAGLAVVLDLHLEPSDKVRVEESGDAQAAVADLWSRLARALADLPMQRLVFELFNEPQFYGAAAWRWPSFQRRLLQAVRGPAPRHRVLLSGNRGGSLDGLEALAPLPDPAVAYTFHYYEPMLFTHQGAHWMDPRWTTAGLHRDVRYPAAAQRGQAVQISQPHPGAAPEMADYLAQDWGPARLARDLRRGAAWARLRGARVVCNEFGVLRAAAQPASRYAWIGDVRRELERLDIGWTLWDYTDIFGITDVSAQAGQTGRRQLEAQAAQALGLVGQAHAVTAGR
jgi:endoglucanase